MDTPSIISPQELAKLIRKPSRKRIGVPASKLRIQDISPVLSKTPKTVFDCEKRFRRLKRVGYLVPVDEQFSFAPEDYGNDTECNEASAWEIFDTINYGV